VPFESDPIDSCEHTRSPRATDNPHLPAISAAAVETIRAVRVKGCQSTFFSNISRKCALTPLLSRVQYCWHLAQMSCYICRCGTIGDRPRFLSHFAANQRSLTPFDFRLFGRSGLGVLSLRFRLLQRIIGDRPRLITRTKTWSVPILLSDRAGQAKPECLHRVVQRAAARRMPE